MFIDHIAICAKDTVSLKDWYVKVFGLKVSAEIPGAMPTFMLSTESQVAIEIFPCKADTEITGNFARGFRHLSLHTGDIDSELKKLEKSGVEIIPELTKLSDGPVKTIYFRDLEGNLIHYVQRF
jgi:glyoxylase I family protein